MQTLLIAERSDDLCAMLTGTFRKEFEITVCRDGCAALEQLRKQKPDVLILDLSLPEIDGITILEELAGDVPSVVLVLTDSSDPYVYQTVINLGAHHILLKPCRTQAIFSHIKRLLQFIPSADAHDPQSVAAAHLTLLGFDIELDGYQYLKLAIPRFAQDPGLRLGKELYCDIGQAFGVGYASVEHAIRASIKTAWAKRDATVWDSYFPRCTKYPCNKQFIAKLAECKQFPK